MIVHEIVNTIQEAEAGKTMTINTGQEENKEQKSIVSKQGQDDKPSTSASIRMIFFINMCSLFIVVIVCFG